MSEQVISSYENGLLSRKLYQEWTNEEWSDDEQDLYTYHNNRLQTFINQFKMGEIWTNFFKKSYNYDFDTSIREPKSLPANLYTIDNYPNPFNASTRIVYQLSNTHHVTIKIYNVKGQLIEILVDNKFLQPGQHKTVWDGMDRNGLIVPSGIYIYEMQAGETRVTGKCLLVK